MREYLSYEDRVVSASRRHRCHCGPDMPGHCPGPANCPYSDGGDPECRVCGEQHSARKMHSQAADDTWICEDCATAQLEDAAGCNEGSR